MSCNAPVHALRVVVSAWRSARERRRMRTKDTAQPDSNGHALSSFTTRECAKKGSGLLHCSALNNPTVHYNPYPYEPVLSRIHAVGPAKGQRAQTEKTFE